MFRTRGWILNVFFLCSYGPWGILCFTGCYSNKEDSLPTEPPSALEAIATSQPAVETPAEGGVPDLYEPEVAQNEPEYGTLAEHVPPRVVSTLVLRENIEHYFYGFGDIVPLATENHPIPPGPAHGEFLFYESGDVLLLEYGTVGYVIDRHSGQLITHGGRSIAYDAKEDAYFIERAFPNAAIPELVRRDFIPQIFDEQYIGGKFHGERMFSEYVLSMLKLFFEERIVDGVSGIYLNDYGSH